MAEFFILQTVLLAVVLLLHTYIGLHIVRRKLIFSDLVLDQLAAFGTLAGIGAGAGFGSPASYFFSLAAVTAGAALLAIVKPRSGELPREAAIGILYAMALIVSLLVADKLPGGSTYVNKTLAGSILWATWPLVAVTTVVYAALTLFHYVFRKRFTALANDPDAPGSRLWDFLLFVTQGIITVLIVPVAGVLLAYAFLMVPAAIAVMYTGDWKRAIIMGWGIGFISCCTGMFASFQFDFPYGPTLVLSLGVAFCAALLIKSVKASTVRTAQAKGGVHA